MTRTKAEPWLTSPWITKSEAAKYIHVSDEEMTALLDSRQIFSSESNRVRGPKRSKVLYVHIADLDAYMRSRPHLAGEGPAHQQPPAEPRAAKPRRAPSSEQVCDPERLMQVGLTAARAAERARKRSEREGG